MLQNKANVMILRLGLILFVSLFTPWSAALSSDAEALSNDRTLFTASYRGKHSGLTINMTKSLIQVGDNQYILKSKAKAFIGSINEESHFLLIDSRLIPISYRYFRSVLGKKSDQRITFNWKDKKARYTRSDKSYKNKLFDIHEGILDPALYQLKLQHELSEGIAPLSFEYVKGGGIKKIEFGEQTLTHYSLEKNSLPAIKLERVNHKKDKHTEITVIPNLNFQIAQVVHSEDDSKAHVVNLFNYESDDELMHAFYGKLSTSSPQSTQQDLARHSD